MPYLSGELPERGDRIVDKNERAGTVTHVLLSDDEDYPLELVIKWDDGIVGIRYWQHNRFMLIERKIRAPIEVQ